MSLLLALLIVIPLLGAAIGAFLPTARIARNSAVIVSLATLACAVGLCAGFNFRQQLPSNLPAAERMAQSVQIQFPSGNDSGNHFAIEDIGFSFHLGIDSISLWLVLLTALLMPLALCASFVGIKDRQKEYYGWMLVLLAAMLGVFVARDLLLFYIFFELTLVPMFFIIGIWGGPQRRYAAGKFFLFTFTGSVFTLAAVIYLGVKYGTFDMTNLTSWSQAGNAMKNFAPLSNDERWWIVLGLLAGFAVKVPLFPVHTWLPLAHTEAPTAGSVILAGVLLKLGTYGLLRLAVPVGLIGATGLEFPILVKFIASVCVVGIIYGALVAWVQQDIKKLVAYSSVSHLGFCVLGLVALNAIGMEGSVLYMINHGLNTGAMFLVVGMIYDRYHTRDINALSGLARKMPKMAFFFVFFVLASIGLPGTNGFVSEFLTVLGAFTSSHLGIAFGVLAAIGVILGALYMLHMTARVIFGPLKEPHVEHGHEQSELSIDLNRREIGILVPIAIAVVVLGVLPRSVLVPIAQPLQLIRGPAGDGMLAEQPNRAEPIASADSPQSRSLE